MNRFLKIWIALFAALVVSGALPVLSGPAAPRPGCKGQCCRAVNRNTGHGPPQGLYPRVLPGADVCRCQDNLKPCALAGAPLEKAPAFVDRSAKRTPVPAQAVAVAFSQRPRIGPKTVYGSGPDPPGLQTDLFLKHGVLLR